MPTDREKNACPNACRNVSPVILEKSGLKKNFTPSKAFGKVSERAIKINNRTNKAGIMILHAFSMPFWMPR